MDVSKAFDRVNHFALFSKLMDRFLPVNLIALFSNWYSKSFAMVSWHGSLSRSFPLYAGVRQGGIMSPILFAIYVDSVILALQNKKLGAQFGLISVGVFMYADDLILISSSVSEMQIMINVCSTELSNLDLTINVKKSACIRIGKRYQQNCSVLTVDSIIIPWSSDLTYLGVAIKASAKFLVDLKPNRTKFYRSFNSVYSKISKANETVIVSLVQTFCISATMYGLEALVLNATLLRSLDNLLFRAFCKNF